MTRTLRRNLNNPMLAAGLDATPGPVVSDDIQLVAQLVDWRRLVVPESTPSGVTQWFIGAVAARHSVNTLRAPPNAAIIVERFQCVVGGQLFIGEPGLIANQVAPLINQEATWGGVPGALRIGGDIAGPLPQSVNVGAGIEIMTPLLILEPGQIAVFASVAVNQNCGSNWHWREVGV